MIKYYTRKAIIQLDTNSISFEIRRLDESVEQTMLFKLHDIAFYQIKIINERFISLAVKLTTDKRQEFCFRRKHFKDEQISADTLIGIIHKYFEEQKIELAPTFLASKKGLYYIVFMLLLLSVAFIIAVTQNKNLPLTILGSMALLGQVISRRITELNVYNKWKQLS